MSDECEDDEHDFEKIENWKCGIKYKGGIDSTVDVPVKCKNCNKKAFERYIYSTTVDENGCEW